MSRITIFHRRSADLALVTFPFTEAGKLLSHFSCNVEAVSGVLLFRLWIRPSQWAVMKKAFWWTEAKTAKWFSHWHVQDKWLSHWVTVVRKVVVTRRYTEVKTQNPRRRAMKGGSAGMDVQTVNVMVPHGFIWLMVEDVQKMAQHVYIKHGFRKYIEQKQWNTINYTGVK